MSKRILAVLCVACLLTSFSACGTYVPGNSSSSGGESSYTSDSSATVDGEASTVSLVNRGLPYLATDGIYAQWTDGYSLHYAPFENGVATVYGLDGDYQVTLSDLPDGYTYNPNVHVTTNDMRDVEVDIYEVVALSGGKGLYRDDGCIQLSTTNMYRVTLESAEDKVYCEFMPTKSGSYSVESWVDVTAEQINPKIDVYNGSFAYKVFSEVLEDGGVSQGYTTNFKHVVEVSEEMIGNSFTFAVYAGSKNDRYPVTIDFAVQLNGEFYLDQTESKMMVPEATLTKQAEYSKSDYTFTTAFVKKDGVRVFDGTAVKFNEDTGYYHWYNEEEYVGYTEYYKDGRSATFADGYGPILYAEISTEVGPEGKPFLPANQGSPVYFSNVESVGNKNLTLSNGTENYKLFIEGWNALVDCGYYWVSQLTASEKQYYSQVKGYADCVNSDGRYAVTEELKVFLQKYSISQHLFADGEGLVESHGYDALEEDQWLFGCGYYQPK